MIKKASIEEIQEARHYAALTQGTALEVIPGAPKPGWQTTEFWLSTLTLAGLVIASVADVLPPKYAAIAASISTACYAIARGLAKSAK